MPANTAGAHTRCARPRPRIVTLAIMIMLLALLLSWQTGTAVDTITDPVEVYGPVLTHLVANAPAIPGSPVVLQRTMYAGVSGRANETHPVEVLRQLSATGKVQVSCLGPSGSGACGTPRGNLTSVSLGKVIDLPEGSRVKVLPYERTPGVPLDEALKAIPDSVAVPATVAVDVVLHTPCPAPPTSDRCRMPDISIYRYFLDWKSNGTYRVVTRWLSGGA